MLLEYSNDCSNMCCSSSVVGGEMPPDEDICDLADFFKVFGDSSRLKVLWALHQQELCVTHLAERLNMTIPAVSHQLKVLRQSHLVRPRREGKNIIYMLSDSHVQRILEMGMEHLDE